MKIKEIIANLQLMRKFVEKGYELPFLLRRAIRINDEIMMKEYLIFDAEREVIKSSGSNEEEINQKLTELINTEIDIKLEKCPYDIMSQVTIPIIDENMLLFMLEMQ